MSRVLVRLQFEAWCAGRWTGEMLCLITLRVHSAEKSKNHQAHTFSVDERTLSDSILSDFRHVAETPPESLAFHD